jgi:hypothetical protein
MRGLVLIFSLCTNFLFGQNPNSQIEINLYLRWDSYPKFNYAINSVSTNSVKINGCSFGIDFAYKIPIRNRLYLKTGLGYYKYAFNKIDDVNSLFNSSPDNSRIVDGYILPGNITPSIIFSTDRYWYNTISLNIGIERHINLQKKMLLVLGASFSKYYTFSQNYHITYPSPGGDNYKQKNGRYFGFGGKIHIGLQKQVKKTSLRPTIILPIYDSWKLDKMFPQEENSMSRNKWLSGFGIGMVCSYTLSKK